jgi:hypothetical protein
VHLPGALNLVDPTLPAAASLKYGSQLNMAELMLEKTLIACSENLRKGVINVTWTITGRRRLLADKRLHNQNILKASCLYCQ